METQPAQTRQTDGYTSLDSDAIEAFIKSSLRKLARFHQLDAITVTTHAATAGLVDINGQLALPVMDYEFQGVDDLSEQYNAARPDFSETGSPRLPGGLNLGAQLFWQQQFLPERFACARYMLTWPQYWVQRLCGAYYNDVTSLGAHTDLYAPHARQFSSLVASQLWSELMPPLANSGDSLGNLTEPWCNATGLAPTTTVHTGIHDSNASLVPHLLGADGAFSVISTGTWIICMSVGGRSVPLDESRDCLFNVNAWGDPVSSARFMGGRERELILQQESSTQATMDQTEAFEHLLATEPSSQALLMPTVVQQAGPYPEASWCWLKSEATCCPAQRACCISLYLALMSADCLSRIGSEGPIHVEGPSAHDAVFTAMLMAITGRPVMVSQAETGTSVGAAMLVTRPLQLPENRAIKLSPDKQRWLQSYAQCWRQALEEHLT